MITLSLTVALFLIGFCAWLALNTRDMIRRVKQNVEVQVYLDKDLKPAHLDSLKQVLSRMPFIAFENDTAQIAFISKEAAANKFIDDNKEDYRNVLSENPFRDAFSFKIKDEFLNTTELPKIKTNIELINGVFEADYAYELIDKINKNLNKAYIIISIFVILLLIAIIILINNTIRLALFSQRFIVRSMQLVGATDRFIQKPFLQRAIIQGLIAGIIATILIFLLQELTRLEFSDFALFQDYSKLFVIALVLIFIGILVSFLCTFQSMFKYLRMNLNELY